MSASLKKQLVTGVGVVIGTWVFNKFLAAPISNALPTKGDA